MNRRHPAEEVLEALVRDGAADIAVTEHVASCDRCRSWVGFLKGAAELLRVPAGTCPEAEALLAHLRASDGWSEAVDHHLGKCGDCASLCARLDDLSAAPALPGMEPGAGAATSLVDRLRRLVELSLPVRLAVAARSAASGATDREVSAGMRAYDAGRYEAAAEHLARARRSRRATPGSLFYLGACQLHGGQAVEAIASLAEAVDLRPRLGEYRWYLAQAQLLAGQVEEAVDELGRCARLRGPYRARATRLLEQIGAATRAGEGL